MEKLTGKGNRDGAVGKGTAGKILACILGWAASFLVYLVLLHLVSGMAGGVLFFRACVISVLSSCAAMAVYWWRTHSAFETAMVYLCCVFALVLFTVFGPVFVDRSVSYHMVFYAADKGEIDMDDMYRVYAQEMLDKRVRDELESGMIYEKDENVYAPTWKAKLSSAVLKAVGRLTGTLEEYEEFSERMESAAEGDSVE